MKKETIELLREDGVWVVCHKDSEEVLTTPFIDTTPFEIVQEKIQSKNPTCNVVFKDPENYFQEEYEEYWQ